MNPRDHYEALGVSPTAPPEVIRAAYLALAKRYHPDGVSPDAERIRRINEAWRVLGRPSSRTEYDKELARIGRSEPDDYDAGGFTFGSAGWGEQDDGTSMLVEEVHDPVASGAPAWGDDFDDQPRPREGSWSAAGDREQAALGDPQSLGVLLWSLMAAGGLTWFGARYLHVGWAVAVLATIVASAWLGWRGRPSWTLAVLIGAWFCALMPVRIEFDQLRWRGGAAIGPWLGWWAIVLLWLGGVALVSLMLFSSSRRDGRPPDDQTGPG